MLTVGKGILRGNTVIMEDDMREYDGANVVVTVLDYPNKRKKESRLIGTAL